MENASAGQPGGDVFLYLYEELKKRFKEKGIHATIQTLERCQVLLQVFLEKRRPLKPCELAESVAEEPAFSSCKTWKSMVLYTLRRMAEAGVVEKREFRGRKSYYHLTPIGRDSKKTAEPYQFNREAMEELLKGCRRLHELLSIMRLWRIPSIIHTIAYEGNQLRGVIRRLRENYGYGQGKLLDMLEERLEELSMLTDSTHGEGSQEEDVERLLQAIRETIGKLQFEGTSPWDSLSLNTGRTLTLGKTGGNP